MESPREKPVSIFLLAHPLQTKRGNAGDNRAITPDTDNPPLRHTKMTTLTPELVAKINDTANTLAEQDGRWNTETAAEFFVAILDEYLAATETPDARDLKPVFLRYANLNAVSNRFAEAGWITRTEKGTKKASLGGLV